MFFCFSLRNHQTRDRFFFSLLKCGVFFKPKFKTLVSKIFKHNYTVYDVTQMRHTSWYPDGRRAVIKWVLKHVCTRRFHVKPKLYATKQNYWIYVLKLFYSPFCIVTNGYFYYYKGTSYRQFKSIHEYNIFISVSVKSYGETIK